MKKTINTPITKGVAKVPVVMQLEALECGAACLAMILAYYSKWIPLEKVRSDCGVSRDGTNAANIVKAANHYGLEVEAYRYEVEDIKKEGKFPCIIHWNFNHFVVLDGFRGKYAYLNDPAKGSYKVPLKEFDESFTGIALEFEPGENFKPEGKPKSIVDFAKKRLQGSKTAILFSFLTTIIASLIAAINPIFSRIFLDEILPQQGSDWLIPFICILAGFNFIEILMSAISAIYSLRINGKMAAVGNATYMWKVLNLPIPFFSQRMAGDIQSRQSSNASIANSLINILTPLIIETGMMIFYLFVMIRYSWILALVGISSIIINTIVSNYISKKRINLTRVSSRDTANLMSTTVAGIESIETIKSTGAENGFFAKWSGLQANENSNTIKSLKINTYLGNIPALVSTLANNIVLFLGVYLVIRGQMTVGMVMAFQGFLTSFVSPAMTLVRAGQSFQEMRTSMERIEDVMEYPTEEIFAEDNDDGEFGKLTGNLEMKDITFGYSSLAEPFIKDFNMTLMPGKSVAIVGASGCGKSTIAKLISGLYQPWSGDILFDGKRMNEIGKDVFHGSVVVVDQDITLFEDTIENNIKMFDSTIEDFEMILAARDAQIHEDIIARPDGYQHKLIEGGRDFSGGQRQRIEIARVLAQDPTLVVLDEATSALDAKTEFELCKAIKDRGIATVVVAHRLSTIRDCDEIIVMKKGQIVGRGKHEELLKNCSLYNDLVTNE